MPPPEERVAPPRPERHEKNVLHPGETREQEPRFEGEDRGGDEYSERPQRAAPAARPAASKPASKPATGFDAMDDDIPF